MAARLTVFGVVDAKTPNARVEQSLAVLYPPEHDVPAANDELLSDISIQTLKRLDISYQLFHHEPVRIVVCS
jgi:hypothetical protein